MKYETIKVLPETKTRFDQHQRELAAKLRREVTQDELVARLLRKGDAATAVICVCGHTAGCHDWFKNACQGEDWNSKTHAFEGCNCVKYRARTPARKKAGAV